MVTGELDKIKQIVSGCRECPLHEGRTQTVFGEGAVDAGIMCIGEGPGYYEDQQGRPFVGRSGELLDKILAACGLNRDQHVYIANIVKCRPPENRTPTREEQDQCLKYLLKQIDLIQPKILVLLGSTALQGLIDPEARISKLRGQWLLWDDFWVMPTYHPSALLRNEKLKQLAWDDFKKVVKKYRQLVDPNHSSEFC